MSQNLNRVSLAGLVRRGDLVALHLRFERPHDGPSLGIFYREFGDFQIANPDIPMRVTVEDNPSVISLVPFSPTMDIMPFATVSTHLGWAGELDFIDTEDCTPIKGPMMPQ